jgi:HD-GYP domain-containing protein (c-di-GMP phosphodiesterase class II)
VYFSSPFALPLTMKKRISIQDLRPGMYITGMDQSWFKTPFLRHKWTIKREDEITLLRSYGIQEVQIDTEKGCDLIGEEDVRCIADDQDASLKDLPGSLNVGPGPDPADIESARLLRAEAISALDIFFHQMEAPSAQHLQEIRGVVSTLLDGILEHPAAMVSLIQMRRFEPNLASHGVDTGVLAMAMGQEHGCGPPQLKLVGLAALLHDVGQLRLPLNLIRKIQIFSRQERKLMQAHCEIGVAILNQFPDIPDESKRMVLEHHERLDGSGYPKGLRGSQISELTQILSIADAYDAQISGRCSFPPVPPARALSDLYRAAVEGQYHSSLVQRLISLLGVFPIGSLVRLNTGEQAVVVWVHSHSRLTPTIKLLKDRSGRPYSDQEIIDLAAQPAETGLRSIDAVLDPHQEGWDISKILEALW